MILHFMNKFIFSYFVIESLIKITNKYNCISPINSIHYMPKTK